MGPPDPGADTGPVAQARAVLAACESEGLTLATAESLTGGLLSAALTAVPGSSAVFRGGVVAYATDAKVSLLGVPQAIIAEHGPVHSTTAAAMARHARMVLDADIGLATTGVAGPDPLGQTPVGTVYVAVDMHGGPARVELLRLGGDRAAIRTLTVHRALALVEEILRRP